MFIMLPRRYWTRLRESRTRCKVSCGGFGRNGDLPGVEPASFWEGAESVQGAVNVYGDASEYEVSACDLALLVGDVGLVSSERLSWSWLTDCMTRATQYKQCYCDLTTKLTDCRLPRPQISPLRLPTRRLKQQTRFHLPHLMQPTRFHPPRHLQHPRRSHLQTQTRQNQTRNRQLTTQKRAKSIGTARASVVWLTVRAVKSSRLPSLASFTRKKRSRASIALTNSEGCKSASGSTLMCMGQVCLQCRVWRVAHSSLMYRAQTQMRRKTTSTISSSRLRRHSKRVKILNQSSKRRSIARAARREHTWRLSDPR